VLAQLACAKTGVGLVTINPASLRSELEYALTMSNGKALIVAPGFKGTDFLAMLQELSPEMAQSPTDQWRSASLPPCERSSASARSAHPAC
jgi:fatty-acyl-CoA synthase